MKAKDMIAGRLYRFESGVVLEFKHIGATGLAICCEPGAYDLQSSSAIPPETEVWPVGPKPASQEKAMGDDNCLDDVCSLCKEQVVKLRVRAEEAEAKVASFMEDGGGNYCPYHGGPHDPTTEATCPLLLQQKVSELTSQLEDLENPRPLIVCLCGSTRFYEEFQKANYRETMAGKIVLSVGFYPHAQQEVHHEALGVTPEEKEALDRLHFRKIEISDEVLILNKNGYIGHSTANELAHARKLKKVVRFLEPEVTP